SGRSHDGSMTLRPRATRSLIRRESDRIRKIAWASKAEISGRTLKWSSNKSVCRFGPTVGNAIVLLFCQSAIHQRFQSRQPFWLRRLLQPFAGDRASGIRNAELVAPHAVGGFRLLPDPSIRI